MNFLYEQKRFFKMKFEHFSQTLGNTTKIVISPYIKALKYKSL